MKDYEEFLKDITELKCSKPELAKELEIIQDMVQSWIKNEIFQGNVMIKNLLKYHEKQNNS